MGAYRTDVFQSEPMADYKAKRAEFLTSHQVLEYGHCPALYRKSMSGPAPRLVFGDSFLIGSATHTLTLEGRAAFEREYIVGGGPINPTTKKPYGAESQKYKNWARETGKACLSDDQFALVCRLSSAVQSHKIAAGLLKTGIAEGVIRAELHGVKCQIRVDWFNSDEGFIDLKTCDDIDRFERPGSEWDTEAGERLPVSGDATRYGYIQQLAFYRSVYQAATGIAPPVYFIAVEKREPYRVGVWRADENALGIAAERNAQLIEQLKVSRAQNHWPTHYEEMRTLAL